MLQVILGVISDFQKPCVSKTASLRVKDTSRSLCYPVLCGHCLPSCQAECQAPGLLVCSTTMVFHDFFRVNMGPYGSQNFKTLLLPQITFEFSKVSLNSICGESNDTITFDLEWPWRSQSKSLRFRSLISCKGAELGHMLPLNINTKAYMGSPLMQLHLTLVTLKDLCQGHSDFESLCLIK